MLIQFGVSESPDNVQASGVAVTLHFSFTITAMKLDTRACELQSLTLKKW